MSSAGHRLGLDDDLYTKCDIYRCDVDDVCQALEKG